MATIGYFLSSEEHGAQALVEQARRAEQAGFAGLWISDHFHPWSDEQGESPFVWATIGGIAQVCELPVTTAVTCPTVRMHPAITAHAAATVATMLPGRFRFGVGSGEALNEQVLGDPWPTADVRLEMLEEAVAVMRELFTGDVVHHHGTHYTVEHARLYSVPDEPPPILVSAFGDKALAVAARIADGLVHVAPAGDVLERYRELGGTGVGQAGVKVCWAADRDDAVRTAHRFWRNQGLPGELSQVLRTPEHFMQASELVTEEMVGDAFACGPDPDEHVEAIREYLDAGFDEVYVSQMGRDQDGFFEFYEKEVLPRL
jgi:G6PDH family F420-dependent oxidoreductase